MEPVVTAVFSLFIVFLVLFGIIMFVNICSHYASSDASPPPSLSPPVLQTSEVSPPLPPIRFVDLKSPIRVVDPKRWWLPSEVQKVYINIANVVFDEERGYFDK